MPERRSSHSRGQRSIPRRSASNSRPLAAHSRPLASHSKTRYSRNIRDNVRAMEERADDVERVRAERAPRSAKNLPPSFQPLTSLLVLIAIIGIIVLVGYVLADKSEVPTYASTSSSPSLQISDRMIEQNNNPNEEKSDASDNAALSAEERTLKVTFAGDCTIGTDEAFDKSTSFNTAFKNKGNPSWFLANVKPIFEDDDLTIVNMEGTLTTASTRQDKTFAFKGDAEFAKVFSSSSVEAASVANNHSYDYGEQSFNDTLKALDAENIQSFGYKKIAYRDVNGVKVAMIGTNALSDTNGTDADMLAHIKEARDAGAQLVLVYIHWGIERDYVPRQNERSIGHAAIDAGADLVIGSHPHVIQGYEKYKDRYIVYSLGNFCFGGNKNPSDKDCMIFQQTFTVRGNDVERNDNINIIPCSISSVSGSNNYQPTPATGSEKSRIETKIKDSTNKIAKM